MADRGRTGDLTSKDVNLFVVVTIEQGAARQYFGVIGTTMTAALVTVRRAGLIGTVPIVRRGIPGLW